MKSIKFCFFFCLVSCATSKQIIGPDGTAHQLVSCEGIEYCYEKAQEVCKGKYSIINTSTETNGTSTAVATSTKLLIKCGN